MSAELSARCEAFALTVRQPERGGPPAIAGRVELGGDGPRAVVVQLVLFARSVGGAESDELGAWTPVAGCSASVERGAESTEFSIVLPPVAASWVGKELRADPGLVASGDDGSELLLVLPPAPVATSRHLLLRGLPKQARFTPPDRFAVGVAMALLGVAVIVFGSSTRAMGAIGVISATAGVVLAGLAFGRARARLVLGDAHVHLEGETTEGGRALAVTVSGVRSAVKGRAGLRAVETERSTGPAKELAELVSRWTELDRRDDGVLTATIPLPGAADAPPSLSFGRAGRVLGFRWQIEVVLERAAGFQGRSSLPLHVGVEGEVESP